MPRFSAEWLRDNQHRVHADTSRGTRPTKAQRQLEDERAASMDEATLQEYIVEWAHTHPDERLHYLLHIHNEAAGKTRTSGIRAGVPDLFLPVASGAYPGLWLELKRPAADNDLSVSQYAEMRRLMREGYAVEVAWTLGQARAVLDCYLDDPDNLLPGY
jgi:hypothetical protein